MPDTRRLNSTVSALLAGVHVGFAVRQNVADRFPFRVAHLVLNCLQRIASALVEVAGGFKPLNLVAGFQALGTLMAVGLMMLPAAVAQLWARTLPFMMVIAAVTAAVSGFLGLLFSYHFGLASGPTIILIAALIYCVSLLFCPSGAFRRLFPARI